MKLFVSAIRRHPSAANTKYTLYSYYNMHDVNFLKFQEKTE